MVWKDVNYETAKQKDLQNKLTITVTDTPTINLKLVTNTYKVNAGKNTEIKSCFKVSSEDTDIK